MSISRKIDQSLRQFVSAIRSATTLSISLAEHSDQVFMLQIRMLVIQELCSDEKKNKELLWQCFHNILPITRGSIIFYISLNITCLRQHLSSSGFHGDTQDSLRKSTFVTFVFTHHRRDLPPGYALSRGQAVCPCSSSVSSCQSASLELWENPCKRE